MTRLLRRRVLVWGYNGYCRLGLGNQQDALVPKIVPQFAGPNEMTMGAHVNAGPSNSVVIDKQGMYWIAGKWKNTGDGTCPSGVNISTPTHACALAVGSGGQPYSTFKWIPEMQYVDLIAVASVSLSGLYPGGARSFMLRAVGLPTGPSLRRKMA